MNLAVGIVTFVVLVAVDAVPEFVQYQQRFGNYSAIGEREMQRKREFNSDQTKNFNKLLLPILSNGTLELRRVNAAAWQEIENADTEDEACLELVHDLFHVYTLFAVYDMQDCARQATVQLEPLTQDDFFRYANFVSRELDRITHHVMDALATYNKILEMDNVNNLLEKYYSDFNWMVDTYQRVLDEELARFVEDHPIVQKLEECAHETVYWHESDMFYVVSYLEWYCDSKKVHTK